MGRSREVGFFTYVSATDFPAVAGTWMACAIDSVRQVGLEGGEGIAGEVYPKLPAPHDPVMLQRRVPVFWRHLRVRSVGCNGGKRA